MTCPIRMITKIQGTEKAAMRNSAIAISKISAKNISQLKKVSGPFLLRILKRQSKSF